MAALHDASPDQVRRMYMYMCDEVRGCTLMHIVHMRMQRAWLAHIYLQHELDFMHYDRQANHLFVNGADLCMHCAYTLHTLHTCIIYHSIKTDRIRAGSWCVGHMVQLRSVPILSVWLAWSDAGLQRFLPNNVSLWMSQSTCDCKCVCTYVSVC